jgi:glycosidase
MAPASTTPTAPASEIGSGAELQLAFEFGFRVNPWDAQALRTSGLEQATRTVGWPPHVLSNHDISRHASRYALHTRVGIDIMARARVAAVLFATLPGTTFPHHGEEIGMTDVAVPPFQATDPNGRTRANTPGRARRARLRTDRRRSRVQSGRSTRRIAAVGLLGIALIHVFDLGEGDGGCFLLLNIAA